MCAISISSKLLKTKPGLISQVYLTKGVAPADNLLSYYITISMNRLVLCKWSNENHPMSYIVFVF